MEELERQLIEIVATDRIDVPISSMSGKLKRRKPKLAKAVDLSISYLQGIQHALVFLMDNMEISIRKKKELYHFARNPQLSHGATKGENRGRGHKADKTKKNNVGSQSQEGSVHNSLFSCNKRSYFKNRVSFKRKRDE